MTLKYGQCVGLGVDLVAKLVSVSEKWLKKLVITFFLVFNSSRAGIFVKLTETPLKISGSATVVAFCFMTRWSLILFFFSLIRAVFYGHSTFPTSLKSFFHVFCVI